ncbi:hypothetical protein [Ornithinibacillus halophilus]|uniref:Uncharacterized protein n=1 Tax=Ornithinibacillus halophilus TaxID=930117 RepID=A0A1M5FVN3_9BACI|nr:hypothetical protein [Ornithinibacillus halophilus]SHF95607.1 hypothetical protein SAMN05216225_101053 [Ornithinibacillus halophilus]
MKKKVLILFIAVAAIFAGISSTSVLATTEQPVQRVDFKHADESEVVKPEYIPALVAIANAARVAQAGVKAAKWAGGAFGVGFTGAAGADLYNRITGTFSTEEVVPEDAEVVFDLNN